jgi:hypothetical protein
MTNDETATIRIPKVLFQKLQSISGELGDVGATWVATRCVEDVLEMVEADVESRRVPKIVRLVDEMRSKGAVLGGETPRAATGTPDRPRVRREIVVKGGKG